MAQNSVKYDTLVDYFAKSDELKFRPKQYVVRAKNLDKLIKIYYGRKNDIEAIVKMSEIYRSSAELEGTFSDLDINSDDLCMVIFASIVKELTDFYKRCEETGLNIEAEALTQYDKDKYFDDYCYAKYFIEMYMEYDKSPFIKDFLEYSGLTIYNFKRFVGIISALDPDLYDKYLEVEEGKREQRRAIALYKEENLRLGVQTGKNKKGKLFTAVDFYANMPFYDDVTAQEVFEDFEGYQLSSCDEKIHIANVGGVNRKFKNFLIAVDPYNAGDILDYAYGNNRYKRKLISDKATVMREKDFMETRYGMVGSDKTLEIRDKEAIINYMKKRDIVPLTRAYEELKNGMFAGSLSLDSENNLVKTPFKMKKLEKKMTFVRRK